MEHIPVERVWRTAGNLKSRKDRVVNGEDSIRKVDLLKCFVLIYVKTVMGTNYPDKGIYLARQHKNSISVPRAVFLDL